MGIYRGTDPLKAYKGDMQPVNVYRGSTKVAGWHSASYSGASPLTVDCDYNVAPDALTITGKCVQTGTPSPDSPAPISTITGNVTITGADGAASDTATVAFGSAVCSSLPDGTHDSYDAVTGVLTKRVGKVVFYGTQTPIKVITNYMRHGNTLVEFTVSDFVFNGSCLSNRFAGGSFINCENGILGSIACYDIGIVMIVSPSITTEAQAMAWLASNPVTVYYKLATPTTIQLTPHLPVVRTGIKTLSVGADVVPTISATVKSMD